MTERHPTARLEGESKSMKPRRIQMPKSIELQPNGSLLSSGEVVGEVNWQAVWPYDFTRVWYAYDPDEDLKEEVHRLRDALSRSQAKLRRVEQDLQRVTKAEGISA